MSNRVLKFALLDDWQVSGKLIEPVNRAPPKAFILSSEKIDGQHFDFSTDWKRRLHSKRTGRINEPYQDSSTTHCFRFHSFSFLAAVPNGPIWYTAAPEGENVKGSNASESILSRYSVVATPVLTCGL